MQDTVLQFKENTSHTIPTWQQQRHYLENETQVYTATTQWGTSTQLQQTITKFSTHNNEVHTA